MATIVQTQTRRRSFMGKMIKWSFILFNLLMAFWLISYWSTLGDMAGGVASDAERAGVAIGGAVGSGALIFLWLAGAVILGILTMLTRGKTIITETRSE